MTSSIDFVQPLAAIALTPSGLQTLQRLGNDITIWIPASLDIPESDQVQVFSGSLKAHLAQLWTSHRGLIFCLATGAVARLVAPLFQDKATDSAVVVVDEAGQYAISFCGGHQAGGDRLTQWVAKQLNATPILTGASNAAGLPGVDVLGVPFGWRKGEGDWTAVSAAIARHATVQVTQDCGSPLWQDHLPPNHPFQFGDGQSADAQVWITAQHPPKTSIPAVTWHPRLLWIGIGCERGTSQALITQAIQQTLVKAGLAERAIAGLATIDLKADEVGLLGYCEHTNLPLRCFSAEELQTVEVPTPSEVVRSEVGTPSVAEAAALLASGSSQLIVTKQIVRKEGEPGAVTAAIAQSDQEFTGRIGKLWLVGTGPGALDQITPAAQSAMSQADVVIGYSLYVDLVKPLLRPGQIIEALPITQERQRAERAIALANWGLTVAVISSGDCGIYGMAGLVLEELRAQGWDGKTPQVQVFPGISALQSAASRVGAPLMHDFCAISLSDLLTPWEMIEKRLHAAAQADFVTALYNPRSRTRQDQIAIAQHIFLQYRNPETPVALVRSAYREDEQVTLTTLRHMLEASIDMLTTVIIGNQSTRQYEGWMITPRGYLGFTD
ncbi:MAG: precorrin-3B C(17)-methyltransferase [Synechococcales cyanobacterium T60_A2020_003]|nr:precorrin-3B C(17)-methyltransferase [Synechococcales cyanobacterium T60_A2020_003]